MSGSETSNIESLTPFAVPRSSTLLPDAEQAPVVQRVQVLRKSGDLELPEHLGRARVRKVDREERVGLPEGYDVGHLAEVAYRIDALARREPLEAADLPHAAVEHIEVVAYALHGIFRRGSHPQVAVELAERELPVDVSVDPTRSP